MLFEATFWPLTSPLLWQPLAIASSLLIVTTLVLGRQTRKKQKTLLFSTGLLVMYVLSMFVDWRSTTLFDVQLYVGVLMAFLLFVIGAHVIVKQLPDHNKKHTSLTRTNQRLALLYNTQHPRYSYAIVGVIIGLLEPVQYSAQTYNALLLFRGSYNASFAAEIFAHIILSLLMSIIILALGYVTVRYATTHYSQSSSQPLLLMAAGTGLMFIAIALVAIIAFTVRL